MARRILTILVDSRGHPVVKMNVTLMSMKFQLTHRCEAAGIDLRNVTLRTTIIILLDVTGKSIVKMAVVQAMTTLADNILFIFFGQLTPVGIK
jgi:hypothetical protein